MTEEIQSEQNPAIRDEQGKFKPGFSGNPTGRPKDTLKAYLQKKLTEMSEEEKESFLEGISKELQWQMAEGRPKQDTDVTTGGESLNIALVQFIDGKDNNNPDTSGVQETV